MPCWQFNKKTIKQVVSVDLQTGEGNGCRTNKSGCMAAIAIAFMLDHMKASSLCPGSLAYFRSSIARRAASTRNPLRVAPCAFA